MAHRPIPMPSSGADAQVALQRAGDVGFTGLHHLVEPGPLAHPKLPAVLMAAGGIVLKRHSRKIAVRPVSGYSASPCTNAFRLSKLSGIVSDDTELTCFV